MTELAVVPQNTDADDIVVIAKTVTEMAVAQTRLIGWAEGKLAKLRGEAAEAKVNSELAHSRKWKVAPFRKVQKVAEDRVGYYERLKAALEAGYTIVPDMPADTFAVRTSRQFPAHRTTHSEWRSRSLPEAESDGSSVGKGRYVTPDMIYDHSEERKKLENGREEVTYYATSRAYDDEFDFPIRLVKPQVLDDTSRAMALRIFDEIGVLSAGSGRHKQSLKASDPIVVGRIVRNEGSKRIACAFLITWWVDSRDL